MIKKLNHILDPDIAEIIRYVSKGNINGFYKDHSRELLMSIPVFKKALKGEERREAEINLIVDLCKKLRLVDDKGKVYDHLISNIRRENKEDEQEDGNDQKRHKQERDSLAKFLDTLYYDSTSHKAVWDVLDFYKTHRSCLQ